jgi:TIR domain-containing protein
VAEVFVSYSRKDASLVAPIEAQLRELGIDAWIDRETPSGERYRQVLRAQLQAAKAVLVCWSPSALESTWVDYEADTAIELGTYIPVFLAPCRLMPPYRQIQTPDYQTGTARQIVLIGSPSLRVSQS